jgi:hypothetical protein
MSLKLRALGLSLIAALAVSAVAVMNASATEGGHFVTTGNSHADIKGFVDPGPNKPHELHLINHNLEGLIGCNVQTYTAKTTTETTTSLTVTPTYGDCFTTNPEKDPVEVTVNGCTYTFTVAPIATPNNTEHTAHLVCPTGKRIEIHHELCTVSVHPQTINGGLTYTTAGSGSTHEITMDINVQFNVTRHGLCQFIAPTPGVGTLKGSATVKAFNTLGNQIPFTAT